MVKDVGLNGVIVYRNESISAACLECGSLPNHGETKPTKQFPVSYLHCQESYINPGGIGLGLIPGPIPILFLNPQVTTLKNSFVYIYKPKVIVYFLSL